jgi:hypothetical protein
MEGIFSLEHHQERWHIEAQLRDTPGYEAGLGFPGWKFGVVMVVGVVGFAVVRAMATGRARVVWHLAMLLD